MAASGPAELSELFASRDDGAFAHGSHPAVGWLGRNSSFWSSGLGPDAGLGMLRSLRTRHPSVSYAGVLDICDVIAASDRDLDLSGNRTLDGSDLRHLVHLKVKLRSIDFRNCSKLSQTAGLEAVARWHRPVHLHLERTGLSIQQRRYLHRLS